MSAAVERDASPAGVTRPDTAFMSDFCRSRWAHEADDLAGGDVQRDVGEREIAAIADFEPLTLSMDAASHS